MTCEHQGCGCDVSGCCLVCPLSDCVLGKTTKQALNLRNKVRDGEITELRRDGVRVVEIASRVKLSRRSIYRILA